MTLPVGKWETPPPRWKTLIRDALTVIVALVLAGILLALLLSILIWMLW